MSAIAPTLQGFFTERLVKQRRVSPRTIASYRDSLKLLFVFVQQRTGKTPATLDWADLDVEVIGAFLEHLETDRHNGPRTRNLRLTAIRSLFAYAALRHPEHAELIQRVLAIPAKRFDKQLVSFLTPVEIDALIDAPDRSRWEGRRDRALLLLAVQTGLRVSELMRTRLRRRQSRRRCPRPLSRQGPQTTGGAVDLTHPSGAAGLADRTRRASRRAAVPHSHRTAVEHRRRATARP